MTPRCYHTWSEPNSAHVHACYGKDACHEAPCVCGTCGRKDYCTLYRIRTNDPSSMKHPATVPA